MDVDNVIEDVLITREGENHYKPKKKKIKRTDSTLNVPTLYITFLNIIFAPNSTILILKALLKKGMLYNDTPFCPENNTL